MSNFPFILPALENEELKNTEKVIEDLLVLPFPVQRCADPKPSYPLEPLLIQYEPERIVHTRRLKAPIFAGVHLRLETLFCYGFHRQPVEKIKGPNMRTDWFNKSSSLDAASHIYLSPFLFFCIRHISLYALGDNPVNLLKAFRKVFEFP